VARTECSPHTDRSNHSKIITVRLETTATKLHTNLQMLKTVLIPRLLQLPINDVICPTQRYQTT